MRKIYRVTTSVHSRAIRVEAYDQNEAESIAADRAALKAFGSYKAHIRTKNINSWAGDGSSTSYECFVGFPQRREPSTYVGKNVSVTVYRPVEE